MGSIVELTFGHNRFDGEPISEQEVEVAMLIGNIILTELFKGCQLHFCIGTYANADGGEPTIEPCSVLKALCEKEIDADCLKKLEALASVIAGFLHQGCVLLSVQRFEGIVRYVTPSGEPTRQEDYPAA